MRLRTRVSVLIAAILCVETVLVYFSFGDLVITGFLGFGAAWFLLDALLVWKNRPYSPTEMRLFMLGWNAAAFAGISGSASNHSRSPSP